MTRLEKIKAITEACVAANPEIAKRLYGLMIEGKPYVSEHILPDIHLADVLLAIWQRPRIKEFTQVVVMRATEPRELICLWNLRRDSLNDQSDELISFIAPLV